MNTTQKSLIGLLLLNLAFAGCTTQEEVIVTPEPSNVIESTTTNNEAFGFAFSYPSSLTEIKNGDNYIGLYDEADYATKKEQDEGPGAGAIPPTFSIEMSSLGDDSFEQFVLNKIGYGSKESLSDIKEFNSLEETSENPMVYEYKTIGNNDVLRVATSDMFYTISYYIENPEKNTVIILSTYQLSDDNDTLNTILNSVQVN